MYYTRRCRSATFTYDNNGNLLTATDGNGHATNYAYNALNERTSATDANGHVSSATYDGNGNVLTVTDGLGHATSMTLRRDGPRADRDAALRRRHDDADATTAPATC